MRIEFPDLKKDNGVQILFKFLNKNKYLITIPKDYSVFFNQKNCIEYKKDIKTQLIRYIRFILIRMKNLCK